MNFEEALSILQPQVALTTDGALMSQAYRKIIARLVAGVTSSAAAGVSKTDFTALSATVAGLKDSLDSLEKRVKKLEQGYQS